MLSFSLLPRRRFCDCSISLFVCLSSLLAILCQANSEKSNFDNVQNQEENMNYMSNKQHAAKIVFFCVNTILCIVCALWTILNRNQWIVKVGQPPILLSVIAGCFISTLSILFIGIETGYREDDPDISKIDAFCMVSPWLYYIGTGITIPMLIVKLKRVQMIHQNSIKNNNNKKEANDDDRKSSIKPVAFKNVAFIAIIALMAKFALLIAFQVYDPAVWHRKPSIPTTDDEYKMESFGYCWCDSYVFFGFALLVCDILILIYTLVLCWQTRGFDHVFAESKYISLAVLFWFQLMLVTVPILRLLDEENRNSERFVMMVYAFLTVFIVLTLLFIPKMCKLNTIKRGKEGMKKKTIPLSALTNSRWDKAVDIINSVLEEDSDTYLAMTEEQRIGLEDAKTLLLKGPTSQKENKLQYIPEALMKDGSRIEENIRSGTAVGSDVLTYRPKRGIHIDDSVRFLMREFGGVNLRNASSTSVYAEDEGETSTCSDDDSQHDIENNLKGATRAIHSSYQLEEFSSEIENDLLYIPKEFHALSKRDQRSLCKLLSWTNLSNWDYNIFELEKISGGHPLLFMGYAILGSPFSLHAMGRNCGAIGQDVSIDNVDGYHFIDNEDLCIPMRKLCNYLRVIEKDYTSDNPYHNEIHGADVLQTLHVLIQMKGDIFPTSNEELFSILLAAVVHDVDHPGENNAFQMNSKTELALVYNDISVLENRHASHAFTTMLMGGNAPTNDNNILCNVKRSTLSSIRKRVIDAVLHTDMSKHFQFVEALRSLASSSSGDLENDADGRWKILQYMLHLADISNPAKPKPLALLWTDRCLEEFFAQGDKECQMGLAISPNCDRKVTKKPDSQIGFINFVIKPAYEVLGQIIPSVKDQILIPHIETNLQYWQTEKEKAMKSVEEAIV